MPRYSVIVEITREVVVDAKTEAAAARKVKAIVDKAQQQGDRNIAVGLATGELYSMDVPVFYRPVEMVEDATSGSGDDYMREAWR
jgi:hypothetical protein